MNTPFHQIALNAHSLSAEAEGALAPEWVHLLPTASGEVQTGDKRGPYHVTDADQIIAASFADADRLPIDINHAIDVAAAKGLPSPAQGWIVEMQARQDGIWGRVEWTEGGEKLVSSRAYRGLSPVILHTKAKQVLGILRASLVNRPNLRGLAALNMENDDMPLEDRLAELLGLGSDAGTDAVFDAVKALHGETGSEDSVALQSQISEIGVALGLGADAAGTAVLNAARDAGNGSEETIAALQSQLNDTTTSLNALSDERAREKAVAFVDGAIAAGRVGVKPRRDAYIARHMEDAEGCEADINAIPSLGPSGLTEDPPGDGAIVSLNAEEIAAKATTYQKSRAEAGQEISFSAAVRAVQENQA